MRNWVGAAAVVLLTATVPVQAHTQMNVAADNLAPEALEKRWGALWYFAGKDLVCTCDPDRITLVRWERPGEVLHMIEQNEYGTNVAVFRIGPDGRGMNDSYWVTIKKDGTLTPQLKAGNSRSGAEFDRPWTVDADGSVVVSAGEPDRPTRFRYRIDGGQLTQDVNRKGQWEVNLTKREIRPADSRSARLAATLRQRAGLQPPGTTGLANAATAASASQEVAHHDATPAPDVQAASSASATTAVAGAHAANTIQAEPGNLTQPEVASTAVLQILDGAYETPRGSHFVLDQEGDSIWVISPTRRAEARRHADGTFRYDNKKDVDHLRIIDPTTVEVVTASGSLLLRRRNGSSVQAQELAYGYFTNVDPRYGGYVIKLEGNKVITAMPDFVSEYYRQPDGTFHGYDPDGRAAYGLRIVNKYTVETYNLPRAMTGVFVRVKDAAPNYIAAARRNQGLADARYEEEQAALDAEWEAEQAAIEAESAYEEDYGASTGSTGANILQGFMKGLSEATASNQAMEQSMQDAANRGLAQGAAEYARRQAEIAREEAEQRRADAEYAREVREQQAAERRARIAAEQARLAEVERARKVQLAANSGSSNSEDVGSDGKVGNAEALPEKGVRVWLAVPMKWKEGNTINPFCFSNVFTVDIAYDPKGWGNSGRMNEAVESLKSSFLAKCSQFGQTDGSVEWYAIGINTQSERSRQHPQDYFVDM